MNNEEAITIFTALAQETRLNIYKLIVKNSLNGIKPTEISRQLDIPKNTLSFHLSALNQAGLCVVAKNGKSYNYKPDCEKIKSITNFLHSDCIACTKNEEGK